MRNSAKPWFLTRNCALMPGCWCHEAHALKGRLLYVYFPSVCAFLLHCGHKRPAVPRRSFASSPRHRPEHGGHVSSGLHDHGTSRTQVFPLKFPDRPALIVFMGSPLLCYSWQARVFLFGGPGQWRLQRHR